MPQKIPDTVFLLLLVTSMQVQACVRHAAP
jgi:hypothetical protein